MGTNFHDHGTKQSHVLGHFLLYVKVQAPATSGVKALPTSCFAQCVVNGKIVRQNLEFSEILYKTNLLQNVLVQTCIGHV